MFKELRSKKNDEGVWVTDRNGEALTAQIIKAECAGSDWPLRGNRWRV